MISREEKYVNKNVALLLKELGDVNFNCDFSIDDIDYPTLWDVQKWLRDECHFEIMIEYDGNTGFSGEKEKLYTPMYMQAYTPTGFKEYDDSNCWIEITQFHNYEDALNAALEKCIKILIDEKNINEEDL